MNPKELAPKIATRIRRYEMAVADVIAAAQAEQKKCTHELCYETPFKSQKYCSDLNARRLCIYCRYEEEGSALSGNGVWQRNDHSPSVLAHSAVLEVLDRDAFYAKRLAVYVPGPCRQPKPPEQIDSETYQYQNAA